MQEQEYDGFFDVFGTSGCEATECCVDGVCSPYVVTRDAMTYCYTPLMATLTPRKCS